jgi:hypothetical protein
MASIIPHLSVDCVLFGFDQKTLKVLLTKRVLLDPKTKEVDFIDYTLLGHHVLENEDLDKAAERVVMDKTGLKGIYLEQFYTFGKLGRMSSDKDKMWTKKTKYNIADHVITVGYFSLVDSLKIKPDQQHPDAHWFPVNELPELGFDHKAIIDKALEMLRQKLSSEPIGFELLTEKFTLSEMQHLYEAVFGRRFDRRNFRKKVSQMKYVIPLDEKQKGVAHKPAQVFIFSKDVYERTKKEKLDFSI